MHVNPKCAYKKLLHKKQNSIFTLASYKQINEALKKIKKKYSQNRKQILYKCISSLINMSYSPFLTANYLHYFVCQTSYIV